jgi:predicted ribosome quality control (RQC) complex YloA/Tae2 family protein
MQALSAAHLTELLAELRPLLVGCTVLAVEPLPPRDVVLVLVAGPNERKRLLRISASADAPRVHLQSERFERYSGGLGPFFTRLAGELSGAKLLALEQPAADRLMLLRVEIPSGERRGLLAELTGRHANLCWLDGSEKLLEILVEAPAARPGERAPRLIPGQPWVPPPGRPPSTPADEDLASALNKLLPAGSCVPEAATLPARRSAGPGGLPTEVLAPLSRLVEAVLGQQALGADRARQAKALSERLERRLARAQSTLAGLEQRRLAAEGAERCRQESLAVPDWFGDGEPRRIELDPKLSPQENVERYFKRYQKLKRSQSELERETSRGQEQAQQLQGLLTRLSAGEDPALLETQAVEAGLLEALVSNRGKRAQAPAPRLPYRRFVGLHGAEILVGRSSRDNDELTFKVARGNDLWLHTADSPGSHVVLRVPKGAEAHPEDVLDACHLAAHFSPLAKSPRVNIHLAHRKEVHKPRGAPAGLVTLSGGKTRAVRIESARLERLLRGQGAA